MIHFSFAEFRTDFAGIFIESSTYSESAQYHNTIQKADMSSKPNKQIK